MPELDGVELLDPQHVPDLVVRPQALPPVDERQRLRPSHVHRHAGPRGGVEPHRAPASPRAAGPRAVGDFNVAVGRDVHGGRAVGVPPHRAGRFVRPGQGRKQRPRRRVGRVGADAERPDGRSLRRREEPKPKEPQLPGPRRGRRARHAAGAPVPLLAVVSAGEDSIQGGNGAVPGPDGAVARVERARRRAAVAGASVTSRARTPARRRSLTGRGGPRAAELFRKERDDVVDQPVAVVADERGGPARARASTASTQ